MFKDNFLFEKDFFKTVFAITLPIAMQNVISFGVNAMDSIMLGSLGDIAVSGANLGGQPFFLMSMVGFGLAGGGNSFGVRGGYPLIGDNQNAAVKL